MRSFFRELRRRNVYKVGAMYAVSGWLVVQMATQVLPIFEVSALAQRMIVLLIVAGFPVALVLSWIYEVTPQGIVRTAHVEPDQSITQHTGRRLNLVTIIVLALAVVFLLAQRYLLPRGDAGAGITDKSIAVLPFESLSEDKSNEYFAVGIQDEILTRLAKIGALKVISRTSTQHYASNPGNLPEIARQLGVANILEGSVQKVGDAVHINVQLIRAATDDHLWAEIYNRKLDDIFGVEGEVAGAIATALNAKLSGAEAEALANKPTDNVAAYDAYLRGLALSTQSYGYLTSRKVRDAYAEAVRLDPKFAVAWAQLSGVTGYLYFNGVDPDKYTAESVKLAADMALQLQPQSTEAQMAQGNYRYRVLRDFAGAQAYFERVLQQAPNNHDALQVLGLVERRQGKWEQALAHLEQASALDPRNAGLMVVIGGETLGNMRRYDEAQQWLDRAVVLTPDDPFATFYKIILYQQAGRISDAAHLIDALPPASVDPGVALARSGQRLLERNYARDVEELRPLVDGPDPSLNGYRPALTLDLGIAQKLSGQAAESKATIDKLIAQLEPSAARVDDSLMPMTLGLAYAWAGRTQEGLAQAQRAVELYRSDAIWSPFVAAALAQVQVLAGDHAGAIATLEPLLKVPGGLTVATLQLESVWDPLRNDAAFQALLKEPVAAPERKVGPN
jgi:TolB-like protein/Flp pilus assembly protein TadD